MFKKYYELTKPGIVYGNALTTLAAFLYASRWHFVPILLMETVLGIGLVIASACVFNNYLDRDIDRKMSRTKNRAFASGAISVPIALIYGAVLGLCGIVTLYVFVNTLTATIALFGFVFYVFIYGWAKRTTHLAAIIGSVPGAVPIVVGYTAMTNHLDSTALILFLILALWQLPHFYAIAIYRFDEYKAAGIPTLPARKGIKVAKRHIVGSLILYIVAASSLTIFGHAGYLYLASTLLFGLVWLWFAVQGFKTLDDAKWARKVFLFSLVVLLTFSAALSVALVVP